MPILSVIQGVVTIYVYYICMQGALLSSLGSDIKAFTLCKVKWQRKEWVPETVNVNMSISIMSSLCLSVQYPRGSLILGTWVLLPALVKVS